MRDAMPCREICAAALDMSSLFRLCNVPQQSCGAKLWRQSANRYQVKTSSPGRLAVRHSSMAKVVQELRMMIVALPVLVERETGHLRMMNRQAAEQLPFLGLVYPL